MWCCVLWLYCLVNNKHEGFCAYSSLQCNGVAGYLARISAIRSDYDLRFFHFPIEINWEYENVLRDINFLLRLDRNLVIVISYCFLFVDNEVMRELVYKNLAWILSSLISLKSSGVINYEHMNKPLSHQFRPRWFVIRHSSSAENLAPQSLTSEESVVPPKNIGSDWSKQTYPTTVLRFLKKFLEKGYFNRGSLKKKIVLSQPTTLQKGGSVDLSPPTYLKNLSLEYSTLKDCISLLSWSFEVSL